MLSSRESCLLLNIKKTRGKIDKHTWTSSEPVYVNKRAKAEMVSNEGRIMEINNEDSMRAIVGEIVCGSRLAILARCCWREMVVVTASNPASFYRRTDERELRLVEDDLVIWREPEDFLED